MNGEVLAHWRGGAAELKTNKQKNKQTNKLLIGGKKKVDGIEVAVSVLFVVLFLSLLI